VMPMLWLCETCPDECVRDYVILCC
jgi:hypothetical protein